MFIKLFYVQFLVQYATDVLLRAIERAEINHSSLGRYICLAAGHKHPFRLISKYIFDFKFCVCLFVGVCVYMYIIVYVL